MTPHIEAKDGEIAKIVIMPGDPLRCKMIAETYLTDYKLVNQIRNQLAYTGYYKGKRVTIFSSGMGNPSMGIYSHELFEQYGVEEIIRVGTCGSLKKELGLYEVVLVDNTYSYSNYLKELSDQLRKTLSSSEDLNDKIRIAAKDLGISMHYGNVFCTDTFYNHADIELLTTRYQCIATEMETFALFANAINLNKKAAAILTVSDNLITHEETTAEERQNSFNKMIELALESILK